MCLPNNIGTRTSVSPRDRGSTKQDIVIEREGKERGEEREGEREGGREGGERERERERERDMERERDTHTQREH